MLSRSLVKHRITRSFHHACRLGMIRPFLLADIGEGITECEVVQWFVEPGTKVAEFDKICEVQSDKASVEISSRYAGSIVKLHYGKHDTAKVGHPLVDIDTDEVEEKKETSPVTPTPRINSDYKKSWELPSVRRLLSEYGIKISDLVGSGKGGIVLKTDVLRHVHQHTLQKAEKKQDIKQEIIHGTSVPLNPIQKIMFKTMTQSLSIPQLGYKDEIELNATTEYREALNKHIANHPHLYPFKKISYLPIFIKSLSLALSLYPIMNSQLLEDKIRYRHEHNIGVAMDTPHGLIVPNVKCVEQKTIFEIAIEIHRLTQLAKKGAISLEDLKGGTITLSNIGSIGGTYANPIIVSNELAIVALGSARRLPRLDEKTDRILAVQTLPISWSADHRIVDGATIAQFSNTWKSFIENPALLASRLH
ncbi:2-oxoacid dehydrogenases acyltransferase-domain-containing protein [Gilbertella persicaria]|uniref:2-oxoacid dehydrogenases acyltransferase-domain-containing protein n=1 Tax=Gilbertella persicaria TaxID=101096 RepID=UPI002221182A|nr:2-oxoacid dehydrogenases acyltransferase-domain-containing protein [Gilbertella persicaria]KAI8076453.1 2-oxoacid dehydrogenases acyltransferase-domain-containing protein [Gilbertella persicaria]